MIAAPIPASAASTTVAPAITPPTGPSSGSIMLEGRISRRERWWCWSPFDRCLATHHLMQISRSGQGRVPLVIASGDIIIIHLQSCIGPVMAASPPLPPASARPPLALCVPSPLLFQLELALVLGLSLIIGKLDLVSADFFIVQVGRVAAFDAAKGLGEDECGMRDDVENAGAWLREAGGFDGGVVGEAHGIERLLDASERFADHADDAPVVKAQEGVALEDLIFARRLGFDENCALDNGFDGTQLLDLHVLGDLDVGLFDDLFGFFVLGSWSPGWTLVIGSAVFEGQDTSLLFGVEHGIVFPLGIAVAVTGGVGGVGAQGGGVDFPFGSFVLGLDLAFTLDLVVSVDDRELFSKCSDIGSC